MPLFTTTWTIKGVSSEARQAAARVASSEGEDLGVWLTRLIRKVSAAEMNAAADAATVASNGAGEKADDKLTSIERAMRRPGTGGLTGNLGSA